MELSTVIFLLLAILGWGVSAFLDKACLKYVDASSAFYVRAIYMALIFGPLAAWKHAPIRAAFAGNKLGPLLILGSVVLSMGGVFFYLKALSGGAATKIVPLSSTYPFVTFALAVLFLGESLTMHRLIGTALLSGGIYFISK
jgi:transporter family protein